MNGTKAYRAEFGGATILIETGDEKTINVMLDGNNNQQRGKHTLNEAKAAAKEMLKELMA